MNQTTTFKRTEETNKVPKDWIPIEEAGLREPNREDKDTFSIRMNNEEYLYELWRTFAGLVAVKASDGRTYLKPAKHVNPMMSVQGAGELIGFIKSQTTSAIALSKTKEEEMKSIYSGLMASIRRELTIHKDKYEITHAQRHIIYSEIGSYLFHQLARAIKGHEANNIITRIEEQKGEHSVTEQTSKKKSSFFGGRSR